MGNSSTLSSPPLIALSFGTHILFSRVSTKSPEFCAVWIRSVVSAVTGMAIMVATSPARKVFNFIVLAPPLMPGTSVPD